MIIGLNRNIIKAVFLICGIFLFSCSQKQDQERRNTFAPTVIESKGYVVQKDSVSEPKVTPAGKPAIVKAGNPKVVPTNTAIAITANIFFIIYFFSLFNKCT